VYVYNVLGQLVAEYSQQGPQGTGGTLFLTSDHLGSTRVVTDQGKAIKGRHDYLPFGEEIPASLGRSAIAGYGGTDGLRHKFTAKERDSESNLDYFGARYYSGAQGRFTSADPYNISFEASKARPSDQPGLLSGYLSKPQVWNKYAYTLNNPLRYVDPTGECSVPANLQNGETGVCIEAFIAAKTINLVGLGDNRGFSSTDPTLTSRARIDIVVKPGNNGVVSMSSEAGKSSVFVEGLGAKGTTGAGLSSVQKDGDGSRRFTVTMEAKNGLSMLPGAPKETISMKVDFSVDSRGNVTLEGGQRDGYPSVGIYNYQKDAQGNVRVKTLYEAKENKVGDLAPPMEVKIPRSKP
jgi:RHS repeat-associated protein